MAFVLRDALFQVKCRQPGCPFKMEFKITQNIMGETEQDCEHEAMKIGRDMGSIKHDAMFGRTHALKDPVIRKVGGSYVGFGSDRGAGHPTAPQQPPQTAAEAGLPHPPGAVAVRKYAKDDVIVRKGERASTVCEVLQGSASPEHTTAIRYGQGSSFGAAGLLSNQARTGSVIALENDTVIAFYNIQELTRSNPAKARELYNEIMEDTLHVIAYLDERVNELEDEVARLEAEKTSAKPAPARSAAKAASPAKAAAKAKGKAKAAKPRPKS
jgi:uncharacterized small protein (DUF1192 family)